MATGLPVLTNVAGETTRIITESKAGIAIPEGDATALTEQIIRLQQNATELKSMSAAGTIHAYQSASWAGPTEQFEQALIKAVGG